MEVKTAAVVAGEIVVPVPFQEDWRSRVSAWRDLLTERKGWGWWWWWWLLEEAEDWLEEK
jgi:hypothetical protein